MMIVEYIPEYKQQCLQLFHSNADKYFADWEYGYFVKFLDNQATCSPYYVVLKDEKAIACGGYEVTNDIATLNWGMVDRQHHNHGVGRLLLTYRLNTITENHGQIPVTIETSQHTQVFFQKHGFHISKTEKNGYTLGLDKVYMTTKIIL